jgi:hypothetical protein
VLVVVVTPVPEVVVVVVVVMEPQKAKAGTETRRPPAAVLAESDFAAFAKSRAKRAKRDDITKYAQP